MYLIRTERLVIQPIGFTDFSLLTKIDGHTREAMNGLYQMGESPWYSYWKISLISGEHAGGLCFMGEPQNGSVEIGYGIFPEYQNRGLMTEAVDGVCRFAKDEGLLELTAETEKDNAASRRVLEKSGFVPGEERAGTLLFKKSL